MSQYPNRIICFLFGLIASICYAQEFPPVEIYAPSSYNAENQNWSISQAENKYIYVANNIGLLEFNGAKWQLYPSPNETIIRSVHVIDDLIYTGSYTDFGFWKRNELGTLIYTSVSQDLNITFLEDEEIWNIIDLDEWILFQSLKQIYIYNKNEHNYSIISPEISISKMFKVNETIYFQDVTYGIKMLVNGEVILISDDQVLKENLVVNMFDHKGQLLIETSDNGFYILSEQSLIKWQIPANDKLSKVSVYNSIQLEDESFLLGTISDGIIHLTPSGEINYEINQDNGLSNNTVLSVFEDVENNIWLALDNGINCININSPFKVYNDNEGRIGTVYSSAVYDGNLYLGSNQGLFFRPVGSNDRFKFIEGTQGQVWRLIVWKDTLFCGHNIGTFVVKGDKAEKVIDKAGTWDIKPIDDQDEDILLQGNYDGLYVIERKNNKWQLRNKIDGFDISSKYFEIMNSNKVFVSHEYKGVFKIEVDNDYTKVIKYSKDSLLHNGLNSSLTKYQNELIYTYKEGVFKYDEISGQFKKDSILSQVFKPEEYTSGTMITDLKNNRLWSFNTKGLSYISPGKLSNIPEINKISFPVSLRNDLTGYENIYYYNEEKYLLGTASGYMIIDLEKLNNVVHGLDINLITIVKYKNEKSPDLISKVLDGKFKNNENNIELFYNVPEYDKYTVPEYRYQLTGIYDDWSEWSTTSSKLFEHLPSGNYTFNVEARMGDENSNNIASYSFEIERPWYFSNLMIGLYVLIMMIIYFIIHNIYRTYYKKQREKLLDESRKELELKELENEQQRMRFKNSSLEKDIENKNRELAISTMSLIKKNEFLNDIKGELNKIKTGENLKAVIEIIDNNLNNTDDWKLFEEAFNNADKNFLKKVKSEHSTLTPNDLRLCAYLRLNLSSKEIAPLLNISHRSVEVKRYRLRKKMELPHEASLTNYILEI